MPLSLALKHYMSACTVTFTPDMDVFQAVQELTRRRISGAPVVDEHGNIIGVLSVQDCVKVAWVAAYHDRWGGKVSKFMNRDVKVLDADMSIVDVPELFMKAPYPVYPVVVKNRLVGQLTRRDLLRALLRAAQDKELIEES